MLASVTYWLSALSSCGTIYSRPDVTLLSDIIESYPDKSFVFSESPWLYLQKTPSSDCAILLLGDLSEYEEAEKTVSSINLRTKVLIITPAPLEVLNITHPKFNLDILQYVNNSIKGTLISYN